MIKSVAACVSVAVLAWLVALGGLVSVVTTLPAVGWRGAVPLVLLCGLATPAVWATRRAVNARRVRAMVPAALLARRFHGSLRAVTDSERRALRPIGASTRDVAARTGALLARLTVDPGVQIFRGLRAHGAGTPAIPHAVSAGRRLLLVESVAWPTGRYHVGPDGGVFCDGTYIGQSVGPLVASVRHWRRRLPAAHRVSAVVVVHPATDGTVVLPRPMPRPLRDDVAFTLAREAADHIGGCLTPHQTTSLAVIAELVAATEDEA